MTTGLPDTEPQTAAGKVLWHFTMSLDGFVAGPNHSMGWTTPAARPSTSTSSTATSPPTRSTSAAAQREPAGTRSRNSGARVGFGEEGQFGVVEGSAHVTIWNEAEHEVLDASVKEIYPEGMPDTDLGRQQTTQLVHQPLNRRGSARFCGPACNSERRRS
ncbi:hypothetical protein [Kribbella shirazensis]|uniref:Dihydrofolate reductase n=1 Tax=Kribbella shirazensis TaxID=1105143 RepID=A0A7X5VC04_9ACTN|nr:hypothetical protein [Kribbella shirazensis]NIK58440.1 hypothetical protein [Kribbella shirazensis]